MKTISKSVVALLLGTAMTMTASAEGTAPGSASWLKMDGEINFDATGSKAADYERSMRVDATLRFEVLMREGIKAVVKARLQQILSQNGNTDVANSHELDQMIEQAYISIETDKISGLPRAIVTVGKQEMAFGQALTQLPMERDGLLYNLAAEREMIGLTVTLPANFFKLVDSIAISLYENGPGDFKVSDQKGVSIKLTKKLADQIQAQASALVKQNEGTDKKEGRGSLGFVFDGKDGGYKVWAEGLVFNNNPQMPDTKVGGQVGGSYKVGPGTVVVEYSYLDKFAHELALAYNLPVNSWLVISPEVRQIKGINGAKADDTRYGIQARLLLNHENMKALRTHR